MTFEVRRDDLRTSRWTDDAEGALGDGQARLRVDHFALTANNVTYAVFGDAMGYWQFFPAGEGWGRVPVWGFADVAESRADGLAEGSRVYGYFPMSAELTVTPERIGDGSFVDAAPHRAALPPVYNQYLLVGDTSRDDSVGEHRQAILRPLFSTSFLIDDWLAESDDFGARSVVLASASSKTALGLAYLLAKRGGIEVIGLTSPANVAFVRAVGYYDRAVEYAQIDELDASTPTVFVDMAGGGRVLSHVHHHFTDELRQSCLVGATHWEESAPAATLPGPAPTFFFAPDRAVKRRADWGPGEVERRIADAWEGFVASVDRWLEIVVRRGQEEVEATWLEVLDGRAAPNVGYVASLPAG